MFLTICQACHKGRKLSANNKNKCYRFYLLCWFSICCLGQYCSLRNWRGLRSRWKSGHQTWYRRFHPNSAPEKIRPQSENILIAFSSQSPISHKIDICRVNSYKIGLFCRFIFWHWSNKSAFLKNTGMEPNHRICKPHIFASEINPRKG